MYGLEVLLPIECEMPSLKLVVELLPNTSIEEERLLCLNHLYETCRNATLATKAEKKWVTAQYDKSVKPNIFWEGDLVFLYNQRHDDLGADKFESLWLGPYIVKWVLEKGAYELLDYDGFSLRKPRNGLYLKCDYAQF